ncbi:MAG: hypothetical protein ACOY3P_04885, partial [Planctomycetota bacterium]
TRTSQEATTIRFGWKDRDEPRTSVRGSSHLFQALAFRRGVLTLPEIPKGLSLWIYSDGSQAPLRVRWIDSSGQMFQCSARGPRRRGWQEVVFPLVVTADNHWGGANDGTVHAPVRLECLLLVDNVKSTGVKGELYLAAPVVRY